MLNENTIPATISNFYTHFDLHRPTKEAINQWWDAFNVFLENYEFALPEIREEFYKDYYPPLKTAIDRANVETVAPLHAMLCIKNVLGAPLRHLLEDATDYNMRAERLVIWNELVEELKSMSYGEIEAYSLNIRSGKPVGDLELYRTYVHTAQPNLDQALTRFKTQVVTERSYKNIASQLSTIKLGQLLSTEDLKHALTARYKQPYSLSRLTAEEIEEHGLQSTKVRLDYILDLEKERLAIRGKPGEPTREEIGSPNVFDKDVVSEALALWETDREALKKSKIPGRLYNRVNNFLMLFNVDESKFEALKPQPRGSSVENRNWLKDHYLPVAQNERGRVSTLMMSVTERRNQTKNPVVFKYFNDVTRELELNFENFANFASKKTMKHTMGLVNALVLSIQLLVELSDEEVLAHAEALDGGLFLQPLKPSDFASDVLKANAENYDKLQVAAKMRILPQSKE